VAAEGLHFDFDSLLDDLAHVESKKFIEKLCSKPSYDTNIDCFTIYFTGNKGFHIHVKTPDALEGADVPERVYKYCTHLAGEFNSFDRSVYDVTRIWRIPNTVNGKTGLYKVPVLADEFFSFTYAEIRNLGKAQRSMADCKADVLKRHEARNVDA
jgi:DNA primase catalytic subunit